MPLSIAERIYLHIQCPRCDEGTLKPAAWLSSRSNLTCKGCSGVIDLNSLENRLLITETEANCKRIEAALKKQSKALDPKKQEEGKRQATPQKRTPARMPMGGGKKDTRASRISPSLRQASK
jgi:hypothetical protein